MSNPGETDATPITSKQQLVDFLAAGCKPPSAFRIGTEHEKFGFRLHDFSPPEYEAPDGVRAMLEALRALGGGTPIEDAGNLIGLHQRVLDAKASISLEPAGQLELSGGALETLHETAAELRRHFDQVRAASATLGLGYAPLGFHPTAWREDMPFMPKSRYAIMRRYMPRVGRLGLDMMTRTCTVQVNLDYSSEDDMRRKLRVGLALQPLATALFANSPFTEGQPNGFQSYRAHVWTDTDPARSGIPAVLFDPGLDFARYVDWVTDTVPMYFVSRPGGLADVAGLSFRAFLDGAERARGLTATVGDFEDHLTTVFTDVRLKRFLEMRGADAGSPEMMLAQSALWVGLLYDPSALDAATGLVSGMSHAEVLALRAAVPREGLAACWRGLTLRALGREVVAIARSGLRARARRNAAGEDESVFLDPLATIVEGGPTQSDVWIDRWRRVWEGNTSRIFSESQIQAGL